MAGCGKAAFIGHLGDALPVVLQELSGAFQPFAAEDAKNGIVVQQAEDVVQPRVRETNGFRQIEQGGRRGQIMQENVVGPLRGLKMGLSLTCQ